VKHPFFGANGPLVFGHRGGGGLAPENTLAAFDSGLSHGADGLELDVRLTRDGHAVVLHDATLDRTTDLRGSVADRTVEEVLRADAGYRFARDGTFPFRGRGIRVPTLADVLARYPGVRIIVELKVDSPALARAAVEAVRAAGALDRVCFGSFAIGVLEAVRTLEPASATSAARREVRWARYRSRLRVPLRRAQFAGYQVPELSGATRIVSPRFVADAHAADLAVQVWTVDAACDARRLLGWGVDALITDRPDIIVPLVRVPGGRGG
jgi:glycerophosphoryl diester phosphodiesterase